MCAGSLLANRELYLTFMRMLNSFEILLITEVDTHPVRGSADPCSLVTMCRHYEVVFRPHNEAALRRSLDAADRRLAEAC